MKGEAGRGRSGSVATVLQLVGRVAPAGGWCLDLERDRFTVVLEPPRPIFGRPAELELLVRSPGEVLYPSSAAVWSDALERARKSGHTWDLVLAFPSPTGGQGWIRSVGHAESRDGRVVRVCGAVQDITLSVAVEQELLRLQQPQVMAEVAPRLAELDSLLVAIGECREAAAEALPEWHPAQRDLASLASALTRGARIMGEIMSPADRPSAPPVPIDLVELIGDLYPALRRAVGSRVLVDIIHRTRQSPVLAHRGQLEQVVLTLALNARERLSGGGALTLSTGQVVCTQPVPTLTGVRPPGSYVELAVHDSGPGLDEDSRSRLFQPCVDDASGLGLLRCLRIVREYEGLMDVESAAGAGTTVRLWLPASRRPAIAATGPEGC